MHSHLSEDVFHEVTTRWKISSRRCLEDQWSTVWLCGGSLSWGSRVLSHSYFQSIEFVILTHSPAVLYIYLCQEKKDFKLRCLSEAYEQGQERRHNWGERYDGSQEARYGMVKTGKQARYRKSAFPGTLCWQPFTSGLQLAFNLNLAHLSDPLPSWALF